MSIIVCNPFKCRLIMVAMSIIMHDIIILYRCIIIRDYMCKLLNVVDYT